MVVARPRAAACARAALLSEVEVAARSSVLPEEAAAQQELEARSALAAEARRPVVVAEQLASAAPQQEAEEARPALAAGVLRQAVAAEQRASAERQQEAAAQPGRGAQAARLRAVVPSGVAVCPCRRLPVAPARRRWNRIAPGMVSLRIASP
jgi:hypothetical protein